MADRRDTNEAALVAIWRGLGCVWINQDRNAGFDGLLVCPRTGLHIVEVKAAHLAPKLTPREAKRKAEIEALGWEYGIIQTERQARELVGIYEVEEA